MRKLPFLVLACLFLLPFLASPADAIPVKYETVYGEVVNISSPSPGYSGGAWAGIYKLQVGGKAVDSFCIDVVDESSTGTHEYNILPLSSAPDGPLGPMGNDKALAISKLWYLYYNPGMSQAAASALQVAIWDVVVDLDYNIGGGNFKSNEVDAQILLDNVRNYTGPTANLLALSNSCYQDYVIRAPVPEPATMLLLGCGLIGLAGFGRKKLFNK